MTKGESFMSPYLGKLEVKSVREGEGLIPMQFAVPGVTGEDLSALKAWYWSDELSVDPEAAIFRIEVRSYLLNVDGLNVLVDTCCGNDKERSVPWAHRLQTQWLQNLAGAGCTPDDIHLVLCTHLHADHVGWNTRLEDGRWVPTFPNARYVFSRKDFEFFGAADARSPQPRGLCRLGAAGGRGRTRRYRGQQRLRAQCADNDAVLYPAHFPDPVAGRVRRAQRHFSYGFL